MAQVKRAGETDCGNVDWLRLFIILYVEAELLLLNFTHQEVVRLRLHFLALKVINVEVSLIHDHVLWVDHHLDGNAHVNEALSEIKVVVISCKF
jgi:hypothetical protein